MTDRDMVEEKLFWAYIVTATSRHDRFELVTDSSSKAFYEWILKQRHAIEEGTKNWAIVENCGII